MLADRLRYFMGILLLIPAFPVLYVQSRKLLKNFPDLPEAENPGGSSGDGSPFKLLILGESSVAGVGVQDHKESLCGHMASELAEKRSIQVEWQVVAKSGYTARKVCDRLIGKIPNEHFDVIMIGLGGNDTFQLTTPWKWKRDMEELFLALHEKHPESKIAVTCMPPVHTFVAFSQWLKFFLGNLTILHGREIRRLNQKLPYLYYFDYVISLEEWITKYKEANKPEDFFSDGVHPSALTYKIWGRETARFIHKRVL